MTHSRLQLVFLGQLVDGSPEAIRARTLQVHEQVASDPLELTLWHDLDADQAQRIERCMQASVPAPRALPVGEVVEDPHVTTIDTASVDLAEAFTEADQEAEAALTPFPVLMDIDVPAPAPKPRANRPPPLRPIRTTKPTAPVARGADPTANRIRCPNCGERQTMRVMCRGCASFLEVALKAKAEREAEAKAKARSGGLLALLGL